MFLSLPPQTQQSQFYFPPPHMLLYLFLLYPSCTSPVPALYLIVLLFSTLEMKREDYIIEVFTPNLVLTHSYEIGVL